ncbi:CAP domain-containing protein [Aquimarina sp. ERC-38]|uniref:CAP domain-containing protein n=1 Tax=Aquimarina sp. ERC-38 TaxID=2949996 RepID=UPI00224592CE|nr:CAP domain-containing protein [Aquimarina sp. ERC-38]UZO82667.1 CAP domain-containing protein [Aquimarina sp. ERC-38]
MKYFNNIAYFLLISIFFFSCTNKDTEDVIEPDETKKEIIENQSIEDQILTLINEHRSSINLSILEKNETAVQLAKEHTDYMISIKKINHDNFDERSKVLRDNENARAFAENVAVGQPTPQSVVQAWLDSPGHRVNIEGDYNYTGIAAIRDSNGRYYYTQIFLKK